MFTAFKDIISYFEFINIIWAKKVLKDDGPDINIGSSSLEINILKSPSNNEGRLSILVIILSSFSPKYISHLFFLI